MRWCVACGGSIVMMSSPKAKGEEDVDDVVMMLPAFSNRLTQPQHTLNTTTGHSHKDQHY